MSTAGGPRAKHASWEYSEQHAGEDPVLEEARLAAQELGFDPAGPGTTAALTALAAAVRASMMVEIGTGAGVSTTALLRGAARNAVLTSIESEPDHVALARRTLQTAGIGSSRTRLITGRAQEVLPRLTAARYDLVLIDADPARSPEFVEQGLRLLRPGGTLLLNNALDGDQVPKPAVRQESTQAMRAAERMLQEDQTVSSALFSTGTGLLMAVKG